MPLVQQDTWYIFSNLCLLNEHLLGRYCVKQAKMPFVPCHQVACFKIQMYLLWVPTAWLFTPPPPLLPHHHHPQKKKKISSGTFYLVKEGCKGQGVIIKISVIKCVLCIRYFNTLFQSQQLKVGIILIYRAGQMRHREVNVLKITQLTSVRGRVQTQLHWSPKHVFSL